LLWPHGPPASREARENPHPCRRPRPRECPLASRRPGGFVVLRRLDRERRPRRRRVPALADLGAWAQTLCIGSTTPNAPRTPRTNGRLPRTVLFAESLSARRAS